MLDNKEYRTLILKREKMKEISPIITLSFLAFLPLSYFPDEDMGLWDSEHSSLTLLRSWRLEVGFAEAAGVSQVD